LRANITLSLEADLIREAKVLAARRGLSVSRMLAHQLEEMVRRDRDYETAMRRALDRLESGFDLQWSKPSARAELYER
jgi:hypothetical protein